MNDRVKEAFRAVQKVISDESAELSASEYIGFLGELVDEAKGWQMTIDEADEDD